MVYLTAANLLPGTDGAFGRGELERVQLEFIKAGIFEVPTYLLNGEMYLGRQPLPADSRTAIGRN